MSENLTVQEEMQLVVDALRTAVRYAWRSDQLDSYRAALPHAQALAARVPKYEAVVEAAEAAKSAAKDNLRGWCVPDREWQTLSVALADLREDKP